LAKRLPIAVFTVVTRVLRTARSGLMMLSALLAK
jgi:hypothetical protein